MTNTKASIPRAMAAGILVVVVVVGGTAGFVGAKVATGGWSLTGLRLFEAPPGGSPEAGTKVESGRRVRAVSEESDVIDAVEQASPAVVSVVVTKDIPKIEQFYSPSPFGDIFGEFFGQDQQNLFQFGTPQYRQNGTERREVGGGTGFLISEDGYVATNRHVVLDEEAEYSVLLNDERRFQAEVLARDQITDFAILKIVEGVDLPEPLELGISAGLKAGQSVIAIGNALGEFRNTVSTGVISGLARSVTASGGGVMGERLTGVIQTDASINPGNSGGPLLNLAGQVIGINTAIVQGAQNIGFAIPIDEIKQTIDSVREHGKIIRPWLGVRYIQVNALVAEQNLLEVDYGALIVRGATPEELAVVPGSPADKAELEENDIILEVEGKKITENNPLNKALAAYGPDTKVKLKVLSEGQERTVSVTLGQME